MVSEELRQIGVKHVTLDMVDGDFQYYSGVQHGGVCEYLAKPCETTGDTELYWRFIDNEDWNYLDIIEVETGAEVRG